MYFLKCGVFLSSRGVFTGGEIHFHWWGILRGWWGKSPPVYQLKNVMPISYAKVLYNLSLAPLFQLLKIHLEYEQTLINQRPCKLIYAAIHSFSTHALHEILKQIYDANSVFFFFLVWKMKNAWLTMRKQVRVGVPHMSIGLYYTNMDWL